MDDLAIGSEAKTKRTEKRISKFQELNTEKDKMIREQNALIKKQQKEIEDLKKQEDNNINEDRVMEKITAKLEKKKEIIVEAKGSSN